MSVEEGNASKLDKILASIDELKKDNDKTFVKIGKRISQLEERTGLSTQKKFAFTGSGMKNGGIVNDVEQEHVDSEYYSSTEAYEYTTPSRIHRKRWFRTPKSTTPSLSRRSGLGFGAIQSDDLHVTSGF